MGLKDVILNTRSGFMGKCSEKGLRTSTVFVYAKILAFIALATLFMIHMGL